MALVFLKYATYQQIFECTSNELRLLNDHKDKWYYVGEIGFQCDAIVNPATSWHMVYQGAITNPEQIRTVLQLLPKTMVLDKKPQWVENMLREIQAGNEYIE